MELHAPDVTITAELDHLGEEIAELSAHLDCATARLLDLIREFDARGGWNNGFRSCAAWLSWRVGLAPGAAREHVRVARALGTLPRLSQAPCARRALVLQGPRADACGHARNRGDGCWRVGRAGTRPSTSSGSSAAGGAWTARPRSGRPPARHASRALHVYPDEDGTVTDPWSADSRDGCPAGEGAWPPPGRALVSSAGTTRTPEADPPSMGQQQDDALGLLAETALHHGLDPGTPGERYQVVVHVDAAVLADADQPGQSVAGRRVARSSRNVPASGVRREPGGDATRRRRHHRRGGRPDADDSAGVTARDAGPGSRLSISGLRRWRFGQGHHIQHWAQGGPTTLSNLAMLCRRHHRAIHEEGYQVERQDDGILLFRRPGGWPLSG